jgi:hypothetical protein
MTPYSKPKNPRISNAIIWPSIPIPIPHLFPNPAPIPSISVVEMTHSIFTIPLHSMHACMHLSIHPSIHPSVHARVNAKMQFHISSGSDSVIETNHDESLFPKFPVTPYTSSYPNPRGQSYEEKLASSFPLEITL